MKRLSILLSVLLVNTVTGQRQIKSFDEMLDYAASKSFESKTADIKAVQAKKAKLAAMIGIPDPSGSMTASFTDNIKQNVSLFPSELVGGEPGTYTAVTTGLRYNTALGQSTELRLVNVPGWHNLKLARINMDIVDNQNRLDRKKLYENVAELYYTILSEQEQLRATRQITATADTLVAVTQNKFNAGQVRQQDVNDAQASLLQNQRTESEILSLIKANYLSLKILCDIPESEDFEIAEQLEGLPLPEIAVPNTLNETKALLSEKQAGKTYASYQSERWPTLSVFSSNTGQQNNNQFALYDSSQPWFNSRYVGLRLSLQLPTASQVSKQAKARYDFQLAQMDAKEAVLETPLERMRLDNDLDKALSKSRFSDKIAVLNQDTFEKTKSLYQEGLIDFKTLRDTNDKMVNSQYDAIADRLSAWLALSKIKINNKVN